MDRRSWPEHAMALAITASARSEDPYKKVGACALSFDHRVLGVAYNGLCAGKNVTYDFWNDRDKRRPFMIHAEQNLLSLFKRNEAKLIAVTLLPCSYCARLICSWNIPQVYYIEDYERDTQARDIFKFYNVSLTKLDLFDVR